MPKSGFSSLATFQLACWEACRKAKALMKLKIFKYRIGIKVVMKNSLLESKFSSSIKI